MTAHERQIEDAYLAGQRESRWLTATMLLVVALLMLTLVLPDGKADVVERLDPSPAACQAAAERDLEARALEAR